MTTCPQCDAAQRDLALAHINHHAKETPMTPDRLTWIPDDGPEALLAIRDRVKAAQDAGIEMEPMTVRFGGAVVTDTPYIDDSDDLMLHATVCCVTAYGNLHGNLTRVEWTPPAEPVPAWADAQAAIAVTSDRWFEIAQTSGEYDDRRGLWFTGGESQGRTVLGQAAEWRRDEATVYPLIRRGKVCVEAIVALGVDDPMWLARNLLDRLADGGISRVASLTGALADLGGDR